MNATPPTGWSSRSNSPTASTTSASRGSRDGRIRRSSATRAKRKTIAGREYDIFIDGDRVKRIAWTRGENSYWVANDLLNSLTNDQMVGIARSAKVMIPNPKPKKRKGAASGAGA